MQDKLKLQVNQVTWLNSPDGMIAEPRFHDPPTITFRHLSMPIDFFAHHPEMRELGRGRLQGICNEWVTRPVARETCVTEIKMNEEFVLGFKAEIGSSPKKDEVYHFPADELLRFVAEGGFKSGAKDTLLAKIASNRRRLGSEIYQRFLVSDPISPSAN
jgi:hypothetical protein